MKVVEGTRPQTLKSKNKLFAYVLSHFLNCRDACGRGQHFLKMGRRLINSHHIVLKLIFSKFMQHLVGLHLQQQY